MTDIRQDWRGRPAAQRPSWPDLVRLGWVQADLADRLPLVSGLEQLTLLDRLGEVCRGERFLLQGGDCAEIFGASEASKRGLLRLLLQMNVVMMFGGGLPVTRVGRIAGQYGKPRSDVTETRGSVTLPSFRGVNVNGPEFTVEARTPDPERLLQAYNDSLATLNLIRTLTVGGFASLRQLHRWNAAFVQDSPAGQRYEQMAREIDRALAFMAACGTNPDKDARLIEAAFYVGHEGLVLDAEAPFLRRDSDTGQVHDLSAHFHWIGERTRQLDGAHVAFYAQTTGPIGLKVGPTMTEHELLALCEVLNPDNIEGRLTLIVRMGADKILQVLPALVRAVARAGRKVVWVSDPMHGNGEKVQGIKTRRFERIILEVRQFFAVCGAEGAWPGGVHVEMTPENVTECLGGGDPILPDHLGRRYETLCDPRLNASQALELAFLVAELLQASRLR
ncbi:MAG TPA: 3-deoxy-7-phosphoheptulonate synthase class II [Candidatus Saccharimonadia bacterium]|nr:3-deoxy-7-phosphoheptulonate synthase class II [Candidatus Saccharimonadia bacterium]